MLWIQLPTSRSRRILCIGVESGILFAAFLASVALRFLGTSPEEGEYPLLIPKAVVAVLILQVALYYADLYEDFTSPSRMELLLRLTTGLPGGHGGRHARLLRLPHRPFRPRHRGASSFP